MPVTSMAKKRKLTPKSAESRKQKQKKQDQNQQQKQQELLNQVATEDPKPEEVEEEEELEEEEEEFEVEEENDDDDDGEPIQKLLEPFSKEQLISILAEAAESHPQVAARVRSIADEDPVHRKVFVHGLGWDTTTETLRSAFSQYGEIEDCKSVADKATGKSKGYGFILFKSRSGTRKALEQPQKKIGGRMASCQLAAVGPVPGGSAQAPALQTQVSEVTMRKIYVSNVGAELDPQKLYTFFARFGEIEEGPLGLDRQTGKPKGFCLFVYKTAESAKKALEEPHKNFEGHILHCQQANDGQKPVKQQNFNQQRNPQYGRNNSSGNMGYGGQMMGQQVPGVQYNQGAAATPAAVFNPAINQALTALLSAQGGLGLQNILGPFGGGGVGAAPGVPGAGQGMQGGYGNQALGSGVNMGYGTQGGYPNQQQGGSRTQHGGAPYSGR